MATACFQVFPGNIERREEADFSLAVSTTTPFSRSLGTRVFTSFRLNAPHEAHAGHRLYSFGTGQLLFYVLPLFFDILQQGIIDPGKDGQGAGTGNGVAAECGAMGAGGVDAGGFMVEEGGAQGKAAANSFAVETMSGSTS